MLKTHFTGLLLFFWKDALYLINLAAFFFFFLHFPSPFYYSLMDLVPRAGSAGLDCGAFHLEYFHELFMVRSVACRPTVNHQMICFLFP